MLRFFENGEDVPFAVEFDDDDESCNPWFADPDKVFRVNADKSLSKVSASRVEVWLERARAISESEAFALAAYSQGFLPCNERTGRKSYRLR